MSSFIIHQETIPIRVSAFHKFPVKAGIDRGSSLTKIAFVSKDSPHDAEIIQLQCVTFLNEHFIEAVKFLKENAQLPNHGSLHVTGVGAATYRDQIKEIVGLDVTFINEGATIGYGAYLFVNNCEPLDIFHPPPDHKQWTFESEMMEDAMKSFRQEMVVSDKPFPALVLYVGSGCGVMKVEEDGRGSFIATCALSGKPFMGLAHALLGTADYNEIMELAERGNCLKADTTFGDLLEEDPDSPYGKFPLDMPAFPFGKASSKSWDRSSCGREDLAASLLRLVSGRMSRLIISGVKQTGVSRVYASGNFFRHPFIRNGISEIISLTAAVLKVDLKFLKTGHAGTVAAMFLDAEDSAKMSR